LGDLTSYQISGLVQLAAYRKQFYSVNPLSIASSPKKIKNDVITKFIELFCGHNFADTDYSVIQQEPLEYDTLDEWIEQASIGAILKSFTYFIWTDKILEGYFRTRIENNIIDKLLQRLEILLKEERIVA